MKLPVRINLTLSTGESITLRLQTVGDNSELDKWAFEAIAPRQLAELILEHQLLDSPPGFAVAHLADAELARLIWQWFVRSDPHLEADEEIVDLAELQRRLRAHYQAERDRMKALLDRLTGADIARDYIANQVRITGSLTDIARQLTDTQERVSNMLSGPLNNSLLAIQHPWSELSQVSSIVSNLEAATSAFAPMQAFADAVAARLTVPVFIPPDLTVFSSPFADGIVQAGHALLLEHQAAEERTTAALAAHKMGFVGGLLPDYVVLRISRVADPTNLRGVLGRLGTWLRSSEFDDALFGALDDFPRSRKRTAIMREAMRAHKERRYALSVPVFISQAEGMLTDYLVRSGLVRRRGSRVYAVDPKTGEYELNDKGKPIELNGWARKLQSARATEKEVMRDLATDLMASFVPQRNGVLHGHELSYARHHRSAYALLVSAVTARALADLE